MDKNKGKQDRSEMIEIFCTFIRKNGKVTPAMAAGVSKTVWSVRDIVNLLDSN